MKTGILLLIFAMFTLTLPAQWATQTQCGLRIEVPEHWMLDCEEDAEGNFPHFQLAVPGAYPGSMITLMEITAGPELSGLTVMEWAEVYQQNLCQDREAGCVQVEKRGEELEYALLTMDDGNGGEVYIGLYPADGLLQIAYLRFPENVPELERGDLHRLMDSLEFE